MTGPYSECPVRLHRDALNTPWGFRLQGGKDFKAPLSVQRVFVGSPADGDLHRGDVLVAIDNYDTCNLTHKQAQDVIKNAGGSLSLRLKRGAGYIAPPKPVITFSSIVTPQAASSSQYRSRPLDSITAKPTPPIGAFSPKTSPGMQQNFGMDYRGMNQPGGRPGPGNMLQKVNASLGQPMWTPDDNQDPEYEYKPIGEIKQIFSHSAPQQQRSPAHGASYKPARRQPWRKPDCDGPSLTDPGWAPGTRNAYAPVKAPAYVPASIPVNRDPPQQQQQHHMQPHRSQTSARPAWSGSLRASSGPRPWEMVAGESLVPGGVEAHVPTGPSSMPRQATQAASFQPQQHHQPPQASPQQQPHQPHNPRVQNTHYGPGGASPQYQQLSPRAADPDTARVVHSQYNSPLGLYSKDNVQQALDGQTTGKPGEGTMHVTGPDGKKMFNPAQSDVYRLLQEEQEIVNHRREHQQQQQHQQQHQQQQQAHADQSARYQDQHGQEMHYQGYMDQATKSPSMMALEAHVLDEGTSDF